VARQGFFHVGNTVSVVDFALPTHVGYGATALFGHASRIGTIKRVRFTNFLDTIIIKILNKKGLKIKKNRTAVRAAGAEQAAGGPYACECCSGCGFWGRGRLSLIFSLLFPYLLS
jgi:hypothetical protein